MSELQPALVKEYEDEDSADYALDPDRSSVWIRVKNISVYIRQNDEGVSVDLFGVNNEFSESEAGAWLTYEEAKEGFPCYQVEYDPEFRGGDYAGTGEMEYIPVPFAERIKGGVPEAFRQLTGLDPVHIIHYSESKLYDAGGDPWEESDE